MRVTDAKRRPESGQRPSASHRVHAGLSESLGGNATAFGYSVTITASFGAVQLRRGPPGFGDLLLFGIGASLVFALVESIEFALAEWVQERRGKACDTDPVDRRD